MTGVGSSLIIPEGGTASLTDATPVFTSCTFGGKVLPIHEFRVVGGTYGSTGRAHFKTSMTALKALNIDLYDISVSSGPSVEVIVYIQYGNNSQPAKIFGGEYLTTQWDYEQDSVEIYARDYLGVLVDQHRLPTRLNRALIKWTTIGQAANSVGIEVQNKQLSGLVQAIAKEFSLDPILQLRADPQIGSQYGPTDRVFTTVPRGLYSVLQTLALNTGYEVFGTPKRQLYFGLPGVGQNMLTAAYKLNTHQLAGSGLSPSPVPCTDPVIEHQPRRNATFSVVVISQDFAKAKTTKGYTTVVAPGIPGYTAGLHTGPDAISTNKSLLAKRLHIPLYTFHEEGMTSDQVQDKATAIAMDIAKRCVVVSFNIDGYIDLLPTKPVKLIGEFDPSFLGMDFFITAYQHHFRMPRGNRGGNGGFKTHVKAWNVAQEALAKGGLGG